MPSGSRTLFARKLLLVSLLPAQVGSAMRGNGNKRRSRARSRRSTRQKLRNGRSKIRHGLGKFDMPFTFYFSKVPGHTADILCVRVVVVVGRLPQNALGGPFHAPRSSLPIKGTQEPLMRDTG
jgi:hypothetical protein